MMGSLRQGAGAAAWAALCVVGPGCGEREPEPDAQNQVDLDVDTPDAGEACTVYNLSSEACDQYREEVGEITASQDRNFAVAVGSAAVVLVVGGAYFTFRAGKRRY